MSKLLDFSKFCENLNEVTSTKIMLKRKFHPEGLFSEQVFGPVRNYTCQCGTYYGVSRSGGKCEICNVDIVNSYERRKRFAKIRLPLPVVNPIFYDLLVEIGGSDVKSAIDDLMKNEKSILFIDGEDTVITVNQEQIPRDTTTWEGTEAIQKLVTELTSNLAEEGLKGWKLVQDNIDNLLIQHIIVLPPDLRPASKSVSKNSQVVDKINRYYVQILTKKEVIENTVTEIRQNKSLFYYYFKLLQKDVNELYHHILGKMSKKEGLIRGNILGKRVDFSGRAIIVPDPTLKLDECTIPYMMFLEMFKIPIAKKLLETRKFKLLNRAVNFVDECIKHKSPALFKTCKDLSNNEVCILNRQPSLHRLGMLGFNIKITLDSIIKVHPLICPPFNADFDGDQMAVYIPITEGAKNEIRDKLFVDQNLSSPADGSLTTTPGQDVVLGIYNLTSGKFLNLQNETECKGEKVSIGVKTFNECLPSDFPLVNESVDKKKLMKILNDIKSQYNSITTMSVLENIKKIGFKYSTLFGTTMSLDDCIFKDSEKIKESMYLPENIRDQLTKISSNETTQILRENFAYSYLVDSGARGNWDQVRQIILTRGFISNFSGEILQTPIKHSLLEGLDQEEFFNSTYGCRKGLLDVALNTGTSGYLSRKLIFTCVNLQISTDLDDCKTTDCLEVYIDSKQKARMLVDRYYLEDHKLKLITNENWREFVGKVVQLRSPVFCRSPKICHKCYGDLYKILHSRFIGVIAAQALGERGTQLVLRTFHTSGSAVIKKDEEENGETYGDMKQMDIVSDLSIVSKLLHQFKGKTYKEVIEELFKIYNEQGNIHHVHFECVVSQLMWHGSTKWRLLRDRDRLTTEYKSIQTVPTYESWLLSLSFSNPKKSILRGILNSDSYHGILDKILKGERIR